MNYLKSSIILTILFLSQICCTPLKFDFKNCGPVTDSLKVINFSITPEPVPTQGNITLSADLELAKPISGPVQVFIIKVSNYY